MIEHQKETYRDPALPIDERVRDLLGRMTLTEKARQMDMYAGSKFVDNLDPISHKCTRESRVKRDRLQQVIGDLGIGCIHDLYPATAAIANDIQRYCRENTRLGIPALISEEALHGLCSPGQTLFPQMIALAAAFNRDLAAQVGAAIAAETRSKGIHLVFNPVLEICRDPRWGRVEETFGEDTCLAGEMAFQMVRGMQGDSLAKPTSVVAEPKHFAVHSQSEGGLNCRPVSMGVREIRRDYLPVFRRAIVDGGACSVMCAYHSIDGIPCAANEWLLQDVLRNEWQFKGFVCSDLGAIARLHTVHKTAETPEEAIRQAVEAGVDMQFYDFDNDFFQDSIIQMVQKGVLSEAAVDRAAGSILRVKFMLGLFDQPYVDLQLSDQLTRCDDHLKLAAQVARECICLLKNNGVLPLATERLSQIALIGPNAFVTQTGDYSADAAPGQIRSIAEELAARLPPSVSLLTAKGTDILPDGGQEDCSSWCGHDEQIDRAAEIARDSDLAILVCGESGAVSGESRDRSDICLPGRQPELVRAVEATGTPIVLILMHGRPLAVPCEKDAAAALLTCWYPGESGAGAIVETLLGQNNPSGKLPMSFPRSVGQIPVHYNRSGDLKKGYVDADASALFDFADGMSFGTYQYSNLRVDEQNFRQTGTVSVQVDLTSLCDAEGMETVLVFVTDVFASTVKASIELKDFRKVTIKARETVAVAFQLQREAFMTLGKDLQWRVEPGRFVIRVGGSLANCLQQEIDLI